MVADIVLVGLDDAEGTDAALATIPDDAVKAPVVVALARGMDTGLRVRAVHAGVTDILDPALSAEAVADALRARVEALTDERATVLAVDDDPVVVEAIAAVLGGDDVDVVGLEDPQRFWEVLTEVRPELLVLDVDMPGFSGVDLCRAARLDPRSRALPIIFLSAHNSPEMVHEVFTAGGDDFVTKPFVGPELRTRILSRIERVRLHRRLADTDPLTGLANRRRLDEDLSRLISLTSRRGEQFVLAVLDVDLFKAVNDEYGHDVGDRALQQLGHHLRRRFRAEDLVGRIGGEEFIVALASSDVDGAVRRLAWVLGDFRRRGVPGHESDMLHIGVSAGAAVFPRDGADFHTLYRTADTALRTAKTTGRGRVLLVGGDGVHLT
jgi:diguanylate cyclase (GGDEF)-like protein